MVTIRLATENDIPRLVELYGGLDISTAHGAKNRAATKQEYIHAFKQIRAASGQQLLVAEDGSEVVGTMTLIIVPNLSHGGLPWAGVENVMVDAKCRGKGIGKSLMDYGLAEAKKTGCYKIQLISDKSRTEAHKFYESLGYKGSGVGFRLYL